MPLRDMVFKTLRKGILTGVLKPGERLMEIHLANKLGVEMPIAQAAYEVLYEGRDAHLVLTELMTREKKHELEDSWV